MATLSVEHDTSGRGVVGAGGGAAMGASVAASGTDKYNLVKLGTGD